jgi:hypothetical protein
LGCRCRFSILPMKCRSLSGRSMAGAIQGNHREHGAMAAASPNECSAANALVSEGRTFDAESSDLRRERHARPGPCRRRALGPPAVSARGLTTPTFRTVSAPPFHRLQTRQRRPGHPRHPALSRAQEHPAHRALHPARLRWLQRLLERRTDKRGRFRRHITQTHWVKSLEGLSGEPRSATSVNSLHYQ